MSLPGIAVFGLGEAGSEIAADLAAIGCEVVGFDPAHVDTPVGVRRVAEPKAAVAGAQAVLAITGGADAPRALEQALGEIPPTAIYADLSAASPAVKRNLAALAHAKAFTFVDVALMTTVPGRGLRTPALASGPGADALVSLLVPLGMPVEAVGADAGLAATRKLLRSVVLKGLAGLVIESMHAANAAGLTDEVWTNLVHQFTAMDEAFLRRIVAGTETHAVRRLYEMEATADLLSELGVDAVMTGATIETLVRIANEELPKLPPDPTL